MSDYAGVTPVPDYLNISDWYELVDGDSIPNGWLTVMLYPKGDVSIVLEAHSYQSARSVGPALRAGHRFFTRTPVPTAIKRTRAAETQQEELPVEPAPLDPELQELRDKLVGHTDPEAMSRRISKSELELKAVEQRLAHVWQYNLKARQLRNKWISEIRDATERMRKLEELTVEVDALIDGL